MLKHITTSPRNLGTLAATIALGAALCGCSPGAQTKASAAASALASAAPSLASAAASALGSASADAAIAALDQVDAAITASALSAADKDSLKKLTATVRTNLEAADMGAARASFDALKAKVEEFSSQLDTDSGKRVRDAIEVLEKLIPES